MGTTQEFFGETLDRTPYSSCAAVLVIAAALSTLAAIGLWNLTGWVKVHTTSLSISTPKITIPSPTNLLQQAKDSAAQAAKTEEDKAAGAAASAAANQVQQQVNQAKNQGAQSLQGFIQ